MVAGGGAALTGNTRAETGMASEEGRAFKEERRRRASSWLALAV